MIAREAPAYDEPTSLFRPHRIGPAEDELPQHRCPDRDPRLRGWREHGGNHESLSPYVTGIGAFVILMLLLWITTRFNRDR